MGLDYEKNQFDKLNFSIAQIINEKKIIRKCLINPSLDKRFSNVVGNLIIKKATISVLITII